MREDVPVKGCRLVGIGLILGLAVAAAGCGSNTVSGKVTYKDQVVRGGTVFFTSGDGKWSDSSAIAEDGTYRISRVPSGTIKVSVETKSVQPLTGPTGSKSTMRPPKDTALPRDAEKSQYGAGAADRYVAIPAQYADRDKSGLTYAATSGKQTYDIPLK